MGHRPFSTVLKNVMEGAQVISNGFVTSHPLPQKQLNLAKLVNELFSCRSFITHNGSSVLLTLMSNRSYGRS
jgi:hypothetical protein